MPAPHEQNGMACALFRQNENAVSISYVRLSHIGEMRVLLARQELLQMDLELAYVTNLRNGNAAPCDTMNCQHL